MTPFKRAAAVVSAMVATMTVLVGTAQAQTTPTDPLSGAGDSFFSTLKDYLTTKLVPAVIGLAIVGVAVAMLIKWGKKGAKSS